MRLVNLAASCVLMSALVGCTSGKTEISGKLTKKGGPLQLGPNIKVSLVFAPETTTKHGSVNTTQTYPTILNLETGQYSVELPPGKYKARVVMFDNSKSPPKLLPVNPEFQNTTFDFSSSKTVDLELEK